MFSDIYVLKWYTKSDFEAPKNIFDVDVRQAQTLVLTSILIKSYFYST